MLSRNMWKNGVCQAAMLTLSLLPASAFAVELAKAEPSQKSPASDVKKEVITPKKPTKEELFSSDSINKISQMYGHLIMKGLDNPVIKLNFDAVIQGMKDGKGGKPAPMTEQEYEESVSQLQEYAYQDLSARNLQEAEKFLKENVKKEGVKEVEGSKLHYLILQEGKGDTVTEDLVPTIKYTGKYLDGTVFGSSDTSGGPIAISLKQTIPGFRKGILGMKVGEKRRLFIHPELGYGTSGQLLPNSLLIFDIEVTGVKPEPKGEPKDKKSGEEGQDLASAENLFPDELEEEDEEELDQDDFEIAPEQQKG